MSNVHKFWNLNSPKMCRDFLKQVRIGKDGVSIKYLFTESGKQLTIDEASDEQILHFTKQIALAIEGGKNGKH